MTSRPNPPPPPPQFRTAGSYTQPPAPPTRIRSLFTAGVSDRGHLEPTYAVSGHGISCVTPNSSSTSITALEEPAVCHDDPVAATGPARPPDGHNSRPPFSGPGFLQMQPNLPYAQIRFRGLTDRGFWTGSATISPLASIFNIKQYILFRKYGHIHIYPHSKG